MNRKTILKWFETFPRPYRDQAIFNTSEAVLSTLEGDPQRALGGSFRWDESPEGDSYWRKFYLTLNNNYSYSKYLKQ